MDSEHGGGETSLDLVARESSPPRLDVGLPIGLALALGGTVVAQAFFFLPKSMGVVWLVLVAAGVLLLHRRWSAAGFLERDPGAQLRLLWVLLPAACALGLGAAGLAFALDGPFRFPIPLPEGNQIEAYMAGPQGWLVFTLYAACVGPLIEEFAFRGWIQRSLTARVGTPLGVILGASVFALFHLWYAAPAAMAVPFALGVAWGTIAALTGSVWAAVGGHALWNGLLMSIHRLELRPEDALYWSDGVSPWSFSLLLGLLGAVVLAVAALAPKRFKPMRQDTGAGA